jgi:hypothetical protein
MRGSRLTRNALFPNPVSILIFRLLPVDSNRSNRIAKSRTLTRAEFVSFITCRVHNQSAPLGVPIRISWPEAAH